ncbi:hypothetical protein TNCV_4924181 [Trichonephila clavipes]|nr:hypothetical protein TNCV_4924181 [Trichonephila clavipes]
MPDIKINDNDQFEEERRLNTYLNSNKLEQLENQNAEINKRWRGEEFLRHANTKLTEKGVSNSQKSPGARFSFDNVQQVQEGVFLFTDGNLGTSLAIALRLITQNCMWRTCPDINLFSSLSYG